MGLSIDKAADKAKWIKAIAHDKLTWRQVGDLKGWENSTAAQYDVMAIPMNFLIDPSARRMSSAYLKAKRSH